MDKRLKIAMVIDTYFPMIDGVVMVVDNYAKRLQKYADVTVFVLWWIKTLKTTKITV